MKKLALIMCLLMMCVFAAGCSSKPSDPTEAKSENGTEASTVTEGSSESVGETKEQPTQRAAAPANVDPDKTYDYEVREIWCENEGQRIYGEAYIPVTDGKSPLVIHSHGLGSNHEAGASFGKKYAQRGIALYAMDFRGGSKSNNENRSDGVSTDMSVLTEVSDVSAVLAAAKTWDFVDTDRIFLQGGSQGGLVTAISGVRHEDEIAGLILHYPAFGMHDIMKGTSDEDLPETADIAGITVGKIFFQDLHKYDVRPDLQSFDKPVLILQGSEDPIVLPSVTKAAADMYPNSEYHIIEGGEHGFSGEYHDEATKYGLDFIFRNIGVEK